jgi:hypothetical protein
MFIKARALGFIGLASGGCVWRRGWAWRREAVLPMLAVGGGDDSCPVVEAYSVGVLRFFALSAMVALVHFWFLALLLVVRVCCSGCSVGLPSHPSLREEGAEHYGWVAGVGLAETCGIAQLAAAVLRLSWLRWARWRAAMLLRVV